MHRLETIYYSELSQLDKFDFKFLLKLFPLYSMYSVWTHYEKCLQRQEKFIVKYGFFIRKMKLNCRKEIYWITSRKFDYFNASSFRSRKNLEKRLHFFHVLLPFLWWFSKVFNQANAIKLGHRKSYIQFFVEKKSFVILGKWVSHKMEPKAWWNHIWNLS